jgi:hypothetical protein
MQDTSSSLLWLRDDESCYTQRSHFSETSEFLDATFTFDKEVFKSRPYQASMPFNMKEAIKGISARNEGKQRSRQIDVKPFQDPSDTQTIKERATTTPSETDPSQDFYTSELKQVEQRGSKDDGSEVQKNPSSDIAPDYDTDSANISLNSLRYSLAGGEDLDILKDSRARSHRKLLRIPRLLKSRQTESSASLRSNALVRDTWRTKLSASNISKILLIGSSTMAVSTLLQSMNLAYGGSYTDSERKTWKGPIYHEVVQNMRKILVNMKASGFSCDDAITEKHAKSLLSKPTSISENTITSVLGTDIRRLWQDERVVDCFHRSSKYELSSSAE